jgi:hypothetical protein
LIAKGETIACPFSMFIRYVESPPDLIECRPSFNPLETNLNLETILSLAAV